jgi:hypothetical protein
MSKPDKHHKARQGGVPGFWSFAGVLLAIQALSLAWGLAPLFVGAAFGHSLGLVTALVNLVVIWPALSIRFFRFWTAAGNIGLWFGITLGLVLFCVLEGIQVLRG